MFSADCRNYGFYCVLALLVFITNSSMLAQSKLNSSRWVAPADKVGPISNQPPQQTVNQDSSSRRISSKLKAGFVGDPPKQNSSQNQSQQFRPLPAQPAHDKSPAVPTLSTKLIHDQNRQIQPLPNKTVRDQTLHIQPLPAQPNRDQLRQAQPPTTRPLPAQPVKTRRRALSRLLNQQGSDQPVQDQLQPGQPVRNQPVLAQPLQNQIGQDQPLMKEVLEAAPPAPPARDQGQQDLLAVAESESSASPNCLPRKLEVDGVDLSFTSIGELSIDPRPKLEMNEKRPSDLAQETFSANTIVFYESGCECLDYRFPRLCCTAADFCYQPLYFEELNLERHGRGHGRYQPYASAIRFFGTVPLLPYKLAAQNPWWHVRTRDPYPSGLPAPWVPEIQPVSREGTWSELAFIAAAILIIP